MSRHEDRVYLERVLESIERIERFTADMSEVAFRENEMAVDATLMQLVNIGEMVNHLSAQFKEAHANLDWHEAVGMRNQITHGYFEIDPETIWRTCQEDLPILKQRVASLLAL